MRPKTLVYCGLNRCDSFDRLVRKFDVAYGFEAIPELAEQAHKRYKSYDNVHIIHGAVGKEASSVEFFIHDNDVASSLGQLGDEYRQETPNKIRVKKKVTVPGINLLSFFKSNGVNWIDLYVSDIQGMDFAVLKILTPYIEQRRIKQIMCETELDSHEYQAYGGIPSNFQSNYEALLGGSYKVIRRQNIQPDWKFQDVTWRLKWQYLFHWHRTRFQQ